MSLDTQGFLPEMSKSISELTLEEASKLISDALKAQEVAKNARQN